MAMPSTTALNCVPENSMNTRLEHSMPSSANISTPMTRACLALSFQAFL